MTSKVFRIAFILICSTLAVAQMPVAELPRTYIDSSWNLPSGGTTWAAHTSAQLASAITVSSPGDIIVVDAGSTYTGNFQLPSKTNPNKKWIYLISSAIAKMPAGTRVSPASTINMAKVVTPNTNAAFQMNVGGNHWRLAGLEVTSASTYGCQPTHNPPINCFSYFLIGPQSANLPLPDSITVDRCYVHGSPTIDLQRAILANASNFAVVDSYIDDAHMFGVDSQGILAYWTPGPLKIVNNYIAGATENIMLGGAGGYATPWVPSDIEIRNNYLFKPLSWVPVSVTQGKMVIKNAFEIKSAQRVLFDSNTIENVWANGQNGYAIVLTVRSSQSGDVAVVNDITITNNVLKNVVSGFNTLAKDDVCGAGGGYPNCHNSGSQDRWYIANNLVTFYDPTLLGGLRNNLIMFNPGMDRNNGNTPGVMRDVVFQHNTAISAASTSCWESVYFSVPSTMKLPLSNLTSNIWLLDNAFCRQPTGDYGQQGTAGLTQYMGSPSTPPYDLTQRFYGNVMYVPMGDKVQTFPTHNYATTVPVTYVAIAANDYQLATPYWTDTSDGKVAGIDNSALAAKIGASAKFAATTVAAKTSATSVNSSTLATFASTAPAIGAAGH
jgi:hypothetical protein